MFNNHHMALRSSLRKDTCLLEELQRPNACGKDDENLLRQIMKCHPSEPESASKSMHLIEALRQFQQTENSPSAYTKVTCYEFHRLLIATVFCYGKMLRLLARITAMEARRSASILPTASIKLATCSGGLLIPGCFSIAFLCYKQGIFSISPTKHQSTTIEFMLPPSPPKHKGDGGGMRASAKGVHLSDKRGNEG
jgi:hypothetical protein